MKRRYELNELGRSLAAEIELKRPLVVFDLESTGTRVRKDRIVEMAWCKIKPSGETKVGGIRLNPGIPIPPEATAVHGITDQDVANEPTFKQIAPKLVDFLDKCDLAGFGVARFDIPLLEAEFLRAEVDFSSKDRAIVDALGIYHRYEPRDLEAAVRHYTGQQIEDAHDAEGDVLSTLMVLKAQLEQHGDLPHDLEGLDSYSGRRRKQPNWYDEKGDLVWERDALHLTFGIHDGKSLQEVVDTYPGYIDWMLGESFSEEVKNAIRTTRAGSPPLRTDTANVD